MRTGITIWLDVPLEALAKRVVAAGVESRPILSQDSADSDPYLQAFSKLQSVYNKRKTIYPGADVRVSLEGKCGLDLDHLGLEKCFSALSIVNSIHSIHPVVSFFDGCGHSTHRLMETRTNPDDADDVGKVGGELALKTWLPLCFVQVLLRAAVSQMSPRFLLYSSFLRYALLHQFSYTKSVW